MFKSNQLIAQDGEIVFCIFLPERPEESCNLVSSPRVLVKLNNLLQHCHSWSYTKDEGWSSWS